MSSNEEQVANVEALEDATERADLIRTLVYLRRQQGLSQQQVAHRMGVTQVTVSEFESGGQEGRASRISIIQRYARAIDVQLRMWIEPIKEAAETTRSPGDSPSGELPGLLPQATARSGDIVSRPTTDARPERRSGS